MLWPKLYRSHGLLLLLTLSEIVIIVAGVLGILLALAIALLILCWGRRAAW